jgi:hypothetical protein
MRFVMSEQESYFINMLADAILTALPADDARARLVLDCVKARRFPPAVVVVPLTEMDDLPPSRVRLLRAAV